MENVQKLYLTVGLPASGKTTWAKNWVAQDPQHRLRVSRNEIRAMLGPSTIITNAREALVSVAESTIVRDALKRGYDVCIDTYHLNPKVKDKWEAYVNMVNNVLKVDRPLKMEYIHCNTTVEECIMRDKLRVGDDQVGEDVIWRMYAKYLKPQFEGPQGQAQADNQKSDEGSSPQEKDMEW